MVTRASHSRSASNAGDAGVPCWSTSTAACRLAGGPPTRAASRRRVVAITVVERVQPTAAAAAGSVNGWRPAQGPTP